MGDVPHIMVAVKLNFTPMLPDRSGEFIVAVRVCPEVSVITEDIVVKPAVPVPSMATMVT